MAATITIKASSKFFPRKTQKNNNIIKEFNIENVTKTNVEEEVEVEKSISKKQTESKIIK